MGVITGNPFFVSCDELFDGRKGSPWSIDGNREYLRRFRVVVKDKRLGPLSICLAPGLPYPGVFYETELEFDELALVSKYDADQEHNDDWQNWIVGVQYSTRMPPGGIPQFPGYPIGGAPGGTGAANDPEMEPAELSWDFETIQQTLDDDIYDYPMTNSSGQRLAKEFEIAYPVLNLTRNERDFSAKKALNYSFAVNKDKFLGAPPGTVQCLPPQATLMSKGRMNYWRVKYKIRFSRIKPDGTWISWQPKLLNNGTMEAFWDPNKLIASDTGVPTLGGYVHKPIMKGNSKIQTPVPLKATYDENGKLISSLEAMPNEAGTIPQQYLTRRIYNEVSFKKLLVRGLS